MKVAKSFFELGPDDSLATVDAYGEKVSEYEPPEAASPETPPPSQSEVADEKALKEKKARAEAAAKAGGPGAGGAAAAEAMAALGEMTGESKDPMSGMSEEEKAFVEEALKKAGVEDGVVVGNQTLDTATVITPVGEFDLDNKDGPRVKAGLKVFANVMGDSFLCGLVEESGKIASATKTLFDLSLDIDLVECISALVNKAQSQKLRKELLRQAAAGFAKKGQLHGLAHIVDNAGPEVVEEADVDVVPTVLTNYRRPKQIEDATAPSGKRPVTDEDDELLYTHMDETLSKVDPHWGYYNRDGVWIPDAQIHRKLSPDAERVMGTDRERRVNIAVAKSHYPGTRARRTEKTYPGSVVVQTA